MSNWYLFSDGQVSGPYMEDHIRQWIRSGRLRPQDRLSRDATEKWLTQDQVPEFAADFWDSPAPSATPPPPAPMPPAASPPQQYAPPAQVQYYVAPPPPMPVQPAMPPQPVAPYAYGYHPPKDKTTAGIFALLLGGVGAHHFYLGNTGLALLYLFVWLLGALTLFIGIGMFFVGIPATLALIEGIIYLTKPEDQFQRNYRNWFCTGL